MANVTWTIKHYDRFGGPITANYSSYFPDYGTSNQLYATNRAMSFSLNSYDTLDLTLYLDDPMAAQVRRMRSYLKVWRTIKDDNGSTIYADPANTPCFAGVVGVTNKNGEANTMSIKAYGMLWKLKLRFHVMNHYLKTNIATGNPYKQSELMWKLIDLINGAFSIADPTGTGIAQGNFLWLANEPVVSPYFQSKGSNTWAHIFDSIMDRAGGVDIIPRYHHTDGSSTFMYFDTDEKRGIDRSGSLNFRFHTGTNDNLTNLVEETQIVPNEFGNYLWAVGHGGPNSGKIAMQRHDGTGFGSDAIGEVGVVMVRKDYPDIKRVGVAGPPPTHLRALADADFKVAKVPQTTYSVTMSPAVAFYYGLHYGVGDVIRLDASKGALVVSNVKQRIYECGLAMSDQNVETSAPTIANDFYGKVAT